MAKGRQLGSLRDSLARISWQIAQGDRDGIATNPEILKRIRAECGDDIERLKDDLVDMALTKLLNEANGRKRRAATDNGPDMFGYVALPTISVGKESWKPVGNMSVRELSDLLRERDAKVTQDKNKLLRDILADCVQRNASEDDKVGAVLSR